MASAAPKLDQRYSYADYATWGDDSRWELDRGAPILMAPGPSEPHQSEAGEIYHQIKTFLKGKSCKPYIAPIDVILAETGDAPGKETTTCQPDVLVVCDKKKIAYRGIVGAPDLVVEVLSPSTARRDQREKLATYERHGVREVWIISPDAEIAKQFVLGTDGKYAAARIFGAEERLPSSAIAHFELDLAEVFGATQAE